MTAAVFVDTNVFVYARDRRDAAKQARARSWLEHLWQERTGRTSLQVLSEYYVTLTRKLPSRVEASVAWDHVQALHAWKPCVIDAAVMQEGREIEQRYGLAWWDSLIVAAAKVQGCTVLLSEDLQDGMDFEGLVVRSPFTFAMHEPRPAYGVASARPGHPRRGRPRKGKVIPRGECPEGPD